MIDFGAGTAELISLFLIVLLIYVLQCICWAPPRAITFGLNFRGQGRQRRQGMVWNALDTAGTLANPLPPLTPLLAVQWPGFELTVDSIQFSDRQGETISIPWEKLEVTHSETKLICNGLRAFKGSETQVLQYVELLGALRQAPRSSRAQIIQDWIRKMMNTEAAAHRLEIFSRGSRWIRIVANVQFVFLFILVPQAFAQFGTGIVWWLIMILAAISVVIAAAFWMLHKTLFPNSGDSRFKNGLIILFSPVAAIRACDALARDLLSGYHPVTVAGALLSPRDFRELAGEQLRLCRYGDYLDKRYQMTLLQHMERTLRQQELDPEELMRAPEAQGGCVVYCPRCLAQYTKERAECTDCGHESLQGLKPVQSAE